MASVNLQFPGLRIVCTVYPGRGLDGAWYGPFFPAGGQLGFHHRKLSRRLINGNFNRVVRRFHRPDDVFGCGLIFPDRSRPSHIA